MAEASDATADPIEAATVEAMWSDVAVAVPPRQGAGQAAALGINFRIDVLKAIQATWQAVHVYSKLHAPFELASAAGIGVSVVTAARTIIAAVVEEMRPIDYLTYVVLSQIPRGVPSGVLEERVAEFIAEPRSVYFAWYLGMPRISSRARRRFSKPPSGSRESSAAWKASRWLSAAASWFYPKAATLLLNGRASPSPKGSSSSLRNAMFTPSLISMMLHSLPAEGRAAASDAASVGTIQDFAASLAKLNIHAGGPAIPVVGRSRYGVKTLAHQFSVPVAVDDRDPFLYFWGRVPLAGLIQAFLIGAARPADDEYIDLGTPVMVAGTGSSFDLDCAKLLPKSGSPPHGGTTPAKVGAAIVDMGVASGSSPDDYGGKLRHAVTSGIELSDHAEQVLSVLLERLDHQGVLADATIHCSLVRPPAANIVPGRSCFDQAGSAEILDAVKALAPTIASDGLPTVVNISLGTHVGPHNGESPLEQYVSGTLVQKDRFVVASAGNEGGTGRAARCRLVAGESELLTVNTGRLCEELLVELWWEDAPAPGLLVEVDLWETNALGARTHLAKTRLNPMLAGAVTLVPARLGLPATMMMQSLFSAKCAKNFSCVAFAISSTVGTALPQLQVRLKLQSARNLLLNAWIVVAEKNPTTAFVEGGAEGTIMVPASDPSVLSVAGLLSGGQVWDGSSRGPAARYKWRVPVNKSPMMAHRAELAGTEPGTSFSSPRACGDAVAALAAGNKPADAKALLRDAYGLPRLPSWNRRYGYHRQST